MFVKFIHALFHSFIHVLASMHVPSVFNPFDRPFLRSFVNASIDLSSLESIRWSIDVGMYVCISTYIYIYSYTFLHTYLYMYIFVYVPETGREWETYVSKLHPLHQSIMMSHTHTHTGKNAAHCEVQLLKETEDMLRRFYSPYILELRELFNNTSLSWWKWP